jgi:hypothetical protein
MSLEKRLASSEHCLRVALLCPHVPTAGKPPWTDVAALDSRAFATLFPFVRPKHPSAVPVVSWDGGLPAQPRRLLSASFHLLTNHGPRIW